MLSWISLFEYLNYVGPFSGGSIELLQPGEKKMIDILHRLVFKVWCTGIWPADWCESICVSILKKGDPREHANYRILSLISRASKILLCIIKERIHAKVEFESSPEQAGFRQGRGTHNHVTSLRILTEKARARKQPLFFCFVDLQQAFDSACHAKLWQGMKALGFPLHLIELIRERYENGKSQVRWGETRANSSCREGAPVRAASFFRTFQPYG